LVGGVRTKLPAAPGSDGVGDCLPFDISIGGVFWFSVEGAATASPDSAALGAGLALVGSVAAWPLLLLLLLPNVDAGRTRGVKEVAPYKLRLA
jgi:hypothetical protein